MTQYARGRKPLFPGIAEFLYTIRAGKYQDISDTLKRGLASSHFLHPKREHPAVGLYMSDMSDLKKPKMFTFVDFFGDI